jgi:hypothetical protein
VFVTVAVYSSSFPIVVHFAVKITQADGKNPSQANLNLLSSSAVNTFIE